MRISANEALQRINASPRRAPSVSGSVQTPIEFVREFGEDEHSTLYLFKKGSDGIIAPADSSLRPVLAECDGADWTAELPPSLVSWLGEYDREIINFQNKTAEASEEYLGGTHDGRVAIRPMLLTTWAQGAPYNDKLLFEGKKSIVGCVAISMGQIIYYWGVNGHDGKKYHRGCTMTPSYTTSTNKYSVASLPPIACFDYKNLTKGAPKTPESINAVSTLLEYCGKSIRSNYTPSLTSASNSSAVSALKGSFRMGSPAIIYASSGEDAFERAIYNELVNGRPVMIGGYRPGGGGHMFNCDGYNATTDMFHFNFGWGGSYNGYYAMSAINPNSREYNGNKSAIIGIQPTYMLGDVNNDNIVDISDVTTLMNAILKSSPYKDQLDIDSDKKITLADLTAIVNGILGKRDI